MGSPVVDFSNSSNWENVYTTSVAADPSPHPANSHYAIPRIEVPVIFDKHILAVLPSSSTAKDWWISGGWIEQVIFTGIVVGGNPDVSTGDSKRLFLNKINLIVFPQYTTTYQLNIDIPYWFKDYQVTIWEYIGVHEDSTEQL
ncbi:MAG: hypothetical protein QNJ68_03575 [Microcoleaceae cyanobacterium MO_207.B10]|nr:hypothetical protein [Microcoleaceae cyanobacterium MO_207.B10]